MPTIISKVTIRHAIVLAASSTSVLASSYVLPSAFITSHVAKQSLSSRYYHSKSSHDCRKEHRTKLYSTIKNTGTNTNINTNTRNKNTKETLKKKSSSTAPNTINSSDTSIHSTKKSKKNKQNKAIDDNELFRVERVVSTRASLSRSEAANMITSRKVAYYASIDDESLTPVKSTKLKIPMNAIIYMNGIPLPQPPPALVVYHKPKNVLSAMDERHSNKKHLGMVVPDIFDKFGMHPVGRLDYDTTGLILFSRSGDLTQRLLHPKYNIEKEYVATVVSSADDDSANQDVVDILHSLKRRLEEEGVETTEGTHFATILEVQSLDLEQSRTILQSYLKNLKKEGTEETDTRIMAAVDNDKGLLFTIRLVVREGKYRMVRRMLANCGHPVVELKRERHGLVELKDLKVGEFRDCTEVELEWANGLL